MHPLSDQQCDGTRLDILSYKCEFPGAIPSIKLTFQTPYTLDYKPILSFVLFTALSTPPNYLWQNLLESLFPGKHLSPAPSAISAASTNDEKELDAEEKLHSIVEPTLNLTNTIIKFVLDQTVGAAVNTVMFVAFFAGLKGLNVEQVGQIVQQDFWGMIRAGWKVRYLFLLLDTC